MKLTRKIFANNYSDYQSETHRRDCKDIEHVSHPGARDGLVDQARNRDCDNWHQRNCRESINPGCPAKEQPPDVDDQCRCESSNKCDYYRVGDDCWNDELTNTQQYRRRNTWPQPKRSSGLRCFNMCIGHVVLYSPHKLIVPFLVRCSLVTTFHVKGPERSDISDVQSA